LAKVLRGFAKDHPELTFRRAYLEGQILEADVAQQLADLPSREELIAKLLNLLQSPIRRLVTALSGPTRGLVTALAQIAEKRESEGGS